VDQAFKLLTQAMRDKDAPMAARVSAANSILDRAYGRAPQDVTIRGNIEHHIVKLIQGLDARADEAAQLPDQEETPLIEHETGANDPVKPA
jgi:hypothetical protein